MTQTPDKQAHIVDWERIELDYRAGIKSLREIADGSGVSHVTISKRAKKAGWVRDLSEKIQQRADDLVNKAMVNTPVNTASAASERETVEANAQAVAGVKLEHRRDIQRARRLTNALLDELEQETKPETREVLASLGEYMRDPEAKRDYLNEAYMAVISLPERSKTMKVLAESLQKLVDMERQAFSMDDKQLQQGTQVGVVKDMTDAERAVRLADLMSRNPAALSLIGRGAAA